MKKKQIMLKWKKKKIKTHTRHYSIMIYDENAMEIGNKNTQYNVRKIKHAIITQRYKCLLHTKFGNQPYPDDTYDIINIYIYIYICKTQIDVQFSNIWPFFTFSNWRHWRILQMTSHPLGHSFETMMEKGQDQIQSTLYFYFSGP
jgi:hypothetical protein